MQLAQLTNWWHSWGEIVFLAGDGVAIILMMVLSKMRDKKVWWWIIPMFALISLVVVDLSLQKKAILPWVIISFISSIVILLLFLIYLLIGSWKNAEPIGYNSPYDVGSGNYGPAGIGNSGLDQGDLAETVGESANDVGSRTVSEQEEFGGQVEEEPTRIVKKVTPAFAWLVGLNGQIKGKRFDLKDSVTSIGRSSTNDIVIGDDSVSKEHAKIKYFKEKDIFKVYDLVSTNGTFVNGESVEAPIEIKDGDEIEFGEAELVFKRLKRRKVAKKTVEDEG